MKPDELASYICNNGVYAAAAPYHALRVDLLSAGFTIELNVDNTGIWYTRCIGGWCDETLKPRQQARLIDHLRQAGIAVDDIQMTHSRDQTRTFTWRLIDGDKHGA